MGSHTATGEWQSFELRMRRRRAERLVLRAEAAADAGLMEEARACLDEAGRLAPGVTGIGAVEEKLATLDAPSPMPAVSPARRLWTLALKAGALAAAAVTAALFVSHRPSAVVPAQDFRAIAEAPAAAVPPVAVAPALPEPVTAAPPAAPPQATEISRRPDPADTRASAAGETSDDWVAPLPAPQPIAASLTRALPVTELPPESPAVPLNTDVAVQTGLPASAPGASLPAPAPASAPVRTPGSGDARASASIRAVLERYAAAYSALDASAAERVWPGVNRAALARAFDALASQEISLGDCQFDVRGATARAQCAGSTRWAPKIGEQSPRTEPRHWTFDLSRAGDGWQIVGARVQNR